MPRDRPDEWREAADAVGVERPVRAAGARVIEYTARLSLATKTRPRATVGCDELTPPPGKPNAHFSVSFGTSRAARPAAAAVWKRALLLPPQPFHAGVVERSPSGGLDVQRLVILAVPVPSMSRNGRRATDFGEVALLLVRHRHRMDRHRSRRDRLVDALRRQHVQRREWRSRAPADLHALGTVTVRTTGLKELCARWRTERESASSATALRWRRLRRYVSDCDQKRSGRSSVRRLLGRGREREGVSRT